MNKNTQYDCSFADARILGEIVLKESGDLRIRLNVKIVLRDKTEAIIAVSSYRPLDAQVGDTVLVWGELRDGNEIAITEFGECRVLKMALNNIPTPPMKQNNPVMSDEFLPYNEDKPEEKIDEIIEQSIITPKPVFYSKIPVDNPTGAPVMTGSPVKKTPAFMMNAKPAIVTKTIASIHETVVAPSIPQMKLEAIADIPNEISEPSKESQNTFISSRKKFRTTLDKTDIKAMSIVSDDN